MVRVKIYLSCYLGHLCYLVGMKYWYIEKLHNLYSKLMNYSSELDKDQLLWRDVNGD